MARRVPAFVWARSGWPFLGLSALATAVLLSALLLLSRWWLVPLLALALFWLVLFLVFFRDPERVPASGLVAPADGRVCVIREEGDRLRIGTFMNVYNVHVNRAPLAGTLRSVEDRGGPKRPAFSAEAEGNSQKRYRFDTAIGPVDVVQITGIVARRCVAFKAAGDRCERGERIGMIVFGSRVDVVVAKERVALQVRVGQRVRAGADTLAEVRG
jgi:phosphatidylserine decarboxylase